MTTPAQDAPLVLPSVAFRPFRLLVGCIALTTVALIAAGLVGQPLLGVFFGLGLALGLLNALLVRRSVESITAADHPLKSKMAMNSASRLLIISVIALTVAAVFAHHGGLGVVIGLALFQVILVLSTMMPVVKKLRGQEVHAGPDADHAEGTILDD